MAGVSISHLIIFVASLLIAAGVVGAAFTGVDHFNDALEDRSIATADELRTDVSIISDPGSNGIYNDTDGNLTLLVKNTGENSLTADPRLVDVLVNGGFIANGDLDLTVLEGDPVEWRPTEVLEVTIVGANLEPGDHRVQVGVTGDDDVLTFRVEDDE